MIYCLYLWSLSLIHTPFLVLCRPTSSSNLFVTDGRSLIIRDKIYDSYYHFLFYLVLGTRTPWIETLICRLLNRNPLCLFIPTFFLTDSTSPTTVSCLCVIPDTMSSGHLKGNFLGPFSVITFNLIQNSERLLSDGLNEIGNVLIGVEQEIVYQTFVHHYYHWIVSW